MSKDSHASALRRHTGQFRRSLLQLTSAGLALLATTMALATWTREGAAASWFLPAAGAAVAAGAFFAATRRLSALAAQILAYGGGLAMAAILLLGESSLLSAAAKLALTAIVATFTLTAPRREALVFDGLAIALVLSAPLVRGTPADELASAIAASTLEAAALGLLCAAAAAIGRYVRRGEHELRVRLGDLDAVVQQADRIARGDLRGHVDGDDDVARVMQAMLVGLRSLVDQVQIGVQILGSSTNQIATMSVEQERGAVHQASAVAETRETIEGFAESSRRIADSARGVLENAERTLKNSELASERINALTNHTRRINELLEFIKEVANKSDLLALNAALEGTKAGEAGRGFSLVAAQMQRLAESTMETVKDVKSLIVDITSATNATVLSMEQATKLAADTTRAAREISLITQQQGSSAEQVVEAMKDIATVTNEFAGGSKDTMNAIEEIKRLAERLHQVAHRFALPEQQGERRLSMGSANGRGDDVAFDAAD